MKFSVMTLVFAGVMGFVFGTTSTRPHTGVALAQSRRPSGSQRWQVAHHRLWRPSDDVEYRGAGVAMKWAKLGHHVKLVSRRTVTLATGKQRGALWPCAEEEVLAVAKGLGVPSRY
jgi:hypothetical protein